MQNQQETSNVSPQNFDKVLDEELIFMIKQKCGIDIAKDTEFLTLYEINQLVNAVHEIYSDFLYTLDANFETKLLVANSVLVKLFNLWRNSYSPKLFFTKIQQKFTPAQIVSALAKYCVIWENYKEVSNFFTKNKQLFPQTNKKIRTIGICYHRFYNGGIERFISLTIPLYIKMGYRVVLFTDEMRPELEYKIAPPHVRIGICTRKF